MAGAVLLDNDFMIQITLQQAKAVGLPETVELYNDPGYGAFGLGVYHQMHCLNQLRKSLYAERYYPNESRAKVLHHVGTSNFIFVNCHLRN